MNGALLGWLIRRRTQICLCQSPGRAGQRVGSPVPASELGGTFRVAISLSCKRHFQQDQLLHSLIKRFDVAPLAERMISAARAATGRHRGQSSQ